MSEKSFIHDKKDLKWFSNLWYHYKLPIILGAFALFVIIGTVSSVLNAVDYDLEIAWFTSGYKSDSVSDYAAKSLEDKVKDADGKDGVVTYCHNYYYDVDSEVKTEIEIASATKIQLELTTGEAYLYIFDEFWLESAKEYQVLDDISSLTGDSEEVYAVDITDTDFIKSSGLNSEKKMYAGIRKLDSKREKDEVYNIKHQNAKDALKYILSGK